HRVVVATPEGKPAGWLPMFAEVKTIPAAAAEGSYDIGIVSDPDLAEMFLSIPAKLRVTYHLAAYMLYRPKDKLLERFYDTEYGQVHLANSRWTADRIETHFPLTVDAIFPGGVDLAL